MLEEKKGFPVKPVEVYLENAGVTFLGVIQSDFCCKIIQASMVLRGQIYKIVMIDE